MNLPEMSALFSPIAGAAAVVMAFMQTHRHGSSSSVSLLVGIPLGLVGGFAIYRGMVRLARAVWKEDANPTSWRVVALLGLTMLAPFISYGICFLISRLVFYVAA